MNKQQLEPIILKKVKRIWKDQEYEYMVRILDNGNVFISVSAMYDTPGLTFKQLQELSKFFFGTTRITTDSFGRGGCETCDFGSSYGFDIIVMPPDDGKKTLDEWEKAIQNIASWQ